MTFAILKLISIFIPLRLTDKQLEIGDEAVHGDAAYELMPVPPAAYPDANGEHSPVGVPTPTHA
jgi:hypothetical protein